MNDVLQALAVVMNFTIALAYVGIGIYVAPSFDIDVGRMGAQIARVAGMLFFITCAGTHFELAWHALTDPPRVGEWFVAWHGLIIHTIQGIAGWVFCVLGIKYLDIRITNTND